VHVVFLTFASVVTLFEVFPGDEEDPDKAKFNDEIMIILCIIILIFFFFFFVLNVELVLRHIIQPPN
jgi:hypothetical protein